MADARTNKLPVNDKEEGSRARAQRNAPSFTSALGALADFLTSGARGAVGATFGWPGDLEHLLANEAPALLSGKETPKDARTFFPRSEDVLRALPPATEFSVPKAQNPFEKITGFAGATPAQVGKAARAAKGALNVMAENAAKPVPRRELQRGAFRMKGGNFDEESLDTYLGTIMHNNEPDDPVNQWTLKQLRNYLRKDIGSPTDPLLAVEKEIPGLHIGEALGEYNADAARVNDILNSTVRGPSGAAMRRIAREHKELTNEPMTPWGMKSTADIDVMRSPYNYAENSVQDLADYADYLPGSPKRKYVEAQKDPQLLSDFLQEARDSAGDVIPEWLLTADSKTRFYGVSNPFDDNLGFGHVLDYLNAATKADEVVKFRGGVDELRDYVARNANNPVGVHADWRNALRLHDAGLVLDPASLGRLSVPDAVRKTAQWNQLMAELGAPASEALSRGIKRVHKEYPEGFRWVELGKPETLPDQLPEGYELRPQAGDTGIWEVAKVGEKYSPLGNRGAPDKEGALQSFWDAYNENEIRAGLDAEGSAMGHCVGGYCDEVANRGTKIYSLRDKNNNPHVTVEVRPQKRSAFNKWLDDMPEDLYEAHLGEFEQSMGPDWKWPEIRGAAKEWYEYAKKLKGAPPDVPVEDIIQIKGKSNQAPVDKYLPYVQDFVKGSQWGRVGDIHNTGLVQFRGGKTRYRRGQGEDPHNVAPGTEFEMPSGYMTPAEAAEFLIKQGAPEQWARHHVGDFGLGAHGTGLEDFGEFAEGGSVGGMSDEEYARRVSLLKPKSGRRAEELNQSRDVNVPLQLLRGWAAGTLGLPGDLEGLVRLLPGLDSTPALPTSDFYREWLPGYDPKPAARASSGLGALFGGVGAGRLARGAASTLEKFAENAAKPVPRRELQRGAVRVKGGNFDPMSLTSYLQGDELRVGDSKHALPWQPSPIDYLIDEGMMARSPSTGRWADKQLANYIKKDLGSPTDPLLALEKEIPGLHLSPDIAEEGLMHAQRVNRTIDEMRNYGRSPSHYTGRSRAYANHAQAHSALTQERLTPWGAVADLSLLKKNPDQYLNEQVREALDFGTLPDEETVLTDAMSQLKSMVQHPDNEAYKQFLWLENADPNTKIWTLNRNNTPTLGFGHVLDYLEAAQDPFLKLEQGTESFAAPGEARGWTKDVLNALRANNGVIPPQIGQAYMGLEDATARRWDQLNRAGLLLEPEQLERLSVADAVRKTAQWNELMASLQSADKFPGLSKGIAAVHKDYPEGFKWVRLGIPDTPPPADWALPEGYSVRKLENGEFGVFAPGSKMTISRKGFKTEEDALRNYYHRSALDEGLNAEGEAMGHCVGGYCEDVSSRGTQIYSLRDANNMPHVTVEVRPGRPAFMDPHAWASRLATPEELAEVGLRRGRQFGPTQWEITGPEFERDVTGMSDRIRNSPGFKKYKQLNEGAPEDIMQIKGKQNQAPVAKYLPYVQDFVKSGNWGRVHDLENTGLHFYKGAYHAPEELWAQVDAHPRYQELLAEHQKNPFPAGSAGHGIVANRSVYDPSTALELLEDESWGVRGHPNPIETMHYEQVPRRYASGGTVVRSWPFPLGGSVA